jgi:hypothetical protein
MSTQPQNKKEMLQEKVVETIKEFVAKEGGITFIDLETLFGRDSKFMAALTKTLIVSF